MASLMADADSALASGDRVAALAAYEAILDIDPDSFDAAFGLGSTLVADPVDGDIERARIIFERLHLQWPDHAGVLYRLGESEMSLRDYSAASRHLRAFLDRADGPQEWIDRARAMVATLPDPE